MPADQLVDQLQQVHGRGHIVAGRVDADHRVAAAVAQSIEDRRRDAARIVGRMVRLQAHRKPARQADRIAKPRHDRRLLATSTRS